MKLYPDEHETIAGTARRLRSGETTCAEVLRGCLDRIDGKEPAVRAWVMVDRDGAEAQARALDQELSAGLDRGPLHGIPIGIKDIIDVAGIPTQCGLAGRRWLRPIRPAKEDAPLVAQLRQAGAVILGKTVSTPFAWIDPPVTRNPWNLDRTPGGSSSGSAAAVACGMCLGAIGTQTGGSIIRPASYCGVAGIKPTYDRVSMDRIVPLAPSLDHAGPIARTVEDLALLLQVLQRPDASMGGEWAEEISRGPPRLLALDDFPSSEDGLMQTALDQWRAEGATCSMVRFPLARPDLLNCHRRILAAEAALVHDDPSRVRERYFESRMPGVVFPERFGELLMSGKNIDRMTYLEELSRQLSYRKSLQDLTTFDALVTPATLGPAPDTSTTGDPMYNSPWSLLGMPAVSFPLGFSADGLPLAVQLIGRMDEDFALLRTAHWCESVIRSRGGLSA